MITLLLFLVQNLASKAPLKKEKKTDVRENLQTKSQSHKAVDRSSCFPWGPYNSLHPGNPEAAGAGGPMKP